MSFTDTLSESKVKHSHIFSILLFIKINVNNALENVVAIDSALHFYETLRLVHRPVPHADLKAYEKLFE